MSSVSRNSQVGLSRTPPTSNVGKYLAERSDSDESTGQVLTGNNSSSSSGDVKFSNSLEKSCLMTRSTFVHLMLADFRIEVHMLRPSFNPTHRMVRCNSISAK